MIILIFSHSCLGFKILSWMQSFDLRCDILLLGIEVSLFRMQSLIWGLIYSCLGLKILFLECKVWFEIWYTPAWDWRVSFQNAEFDISPLWNNVVVIAIAEHCCLDMYLCWLFQQSGNIPCHIGVNDVGVHIINSQTKVSSSGSILAPSMILFHVFLRLDCHDLRSGGGWSFSSSCTD